MKKATLIVLFALGAMLCYCTDFTLSDGSVIIGQLKGISSDRMYVLDSTQMLHILDFVQISKINDGSGDVSFLWKRRKPFMDPSLDQYSLLISNPQSASHPVYSRPSTYDNVGETDEPIPDTSKEPLLTDQQKETVLPSAITIPPNVKQELTEQDTANKHLERISKALWTQVYLAEGCIALTLITSILLLATR